MSITFRYLELLNALVVSGSISKATRLTGLSQPTISQQLAKFEEELGTQLIYRRRGKKIELTPAGEHWFHASTELLDRRQHFEMLHKHSFGNEQIVLRFGATPSLRGQFTSAAAKIAIEIGRFTRFEQVFALSSKEIVELIDTHKINCAVVSEASVSDHLGSLSIRPLFRDRVVWIVPDSLSEDEIAETFARGCVNQHSHPALRHFIELSAPIPWDGISRSWYHEYLSGSVPYFVCPTHQSAVDLVSGGLATCHCPMSLLPNLPQSMLDDLRFYSLEDFGREAVFVMPKHLSSLSPFTTFQDRLCAYVHQTFSSQEMVSLVRDLPLAAEGFVRRTRPERGRAVS